MQSGRLFAFLAVLATPAAAQSYANLYGRILDASEAGIPNAAVTVVNQDTGFRRSTQSDATGAYSVGALHPGAYKITARKEGFRTAVRFGVILVPSGASRADFLLPVGPVEETITVEGTAPMIEQDSAAAGIHTDRQEIERLPLNGRGLLTLLEMAPGSNVVPATRGDAGQFTVNGQRPNANYFTVDGVSANNGIAAGGLPAQSTGGALPALSAFGSMDSIISLEAVQDFHSVTSTSVAEFGRLPGANVALSSRSGSNEFHGSTLYRIRNESLNANNWFGNQAGYGRLPERLHDVTQTFGGPVWRNHTFFFLSYQHLSLRQPYAWRQPVPTAASRATAADWAQPLLNLFPEPTGATLAGGVGEWFGRNTRPASLNTGSARFDQGIGSRVTLFGRYNDSPSVNQFGALVINQLDLRSRSATLGANARITGRTVLDFRINHSLASGSSLWVDSAGCSLAPLTAAFVTTPTPCDYLVRFSIGGIGQLVSGREGDRRQRQFQVLQTAALHRNRHQVQFGVDYRTISARGSDPPGTLGVIADSLSALVDTHNLWVSTKQPRSTSVDVQELSIWAMETWQPTARLTISAGLRWEYSPAPVPDIDVYFLDVPSDRLVTNRRALWPTRFNNFAPRAGAVVRLTKDGRTVFRAGGGLYFDSSLSIATDILNGGPLSITNFTSAVTAPFNSQLTFGFTPGLVIPRITQWNAALERAITANSVISIGYLGSTGRSLIRREVGGAANTPTSWVALTTNGGESDYHALALQFRRRMARGLHATASYTWSHAIDDDSSDAFLIWAGPGSTNRGSSDFDVRHAFIGTMSYEVPHLRGWSIDTVVRARSGFPVTPLQSEQYLGIPLSNAFRPNLALNQPFWIDDAAIGGGRKLNAAAFLPAKAGTQGILGRNVLSGFGMWQVDLAAAREFHWTERVRLHLRVEAFNALNHPNFADPVKYWNSPVFGQSTSMLNMMLGTGSPGSGVAPAFQTGAPRSIQGSIRFQF